MLGVTHSPVFSLFLSSPNDCSLVHFNSLSLSLSRSFSLASVVDDCYCQSRPLSWASRTLFVLSAPFIVSNGKVIFLLVLEVHSCLRMKQRKRKNRRGGWEVRWEEQFMKKPIIHASLDSIQLSEWMSERKREKRSEEKREREEVALKKEG